MNISSLGEKEKYADLISSQKFATTNYNIWAGECVDVNLRNEFLKILNDEHNIQQTLFQQAQSKGYYPIKQATPEDITTTKQKFPAM